MSSGSGGENLSISAIEKCSFREVEESRYGVYMKLKACTTIFYPRGDRSIVWVINEVGVASFSFAKFYEEEIRGGYETHSNLNFSAMNHDWWHVVVMMR
jgi:hypothetical protein